MATKTIRDLEDSEVRGKRALVRVDFNVPLDEKGEVADDTRIRASLPTIDALFDHGARVVVLLSHLGRPKGKPDPAFSLAPVASRLVKLSSHPVIFVPSTISDEGLTATRTAPPGTIVLLENTRFLAGEEKNDAGLSRQLAGLGDFYVNDAFGSAHRAHASTEGVARYLHPAVAGLLMERELRYLGDALDSPERPFVAILGGAKISGKIDVIDNLLPKVDRLLIGGAMCCTFFRAMGLETGGSLVESDRVELAGKVLASARDKLVLPSDVVVAPSMTDGARAHSVQRDAIPAAEAVFDIGPESSKSFARAIESARTVIWNGPMGVFERPPFDAGTRAVGEAMASATQGGATTIVGGGDSAAAMEEMGLAQRVSHVSTGGGASLEFLEGKTLPGVAALDQRGAE
ncbi:MAG TPA: phosphoglycerate kinase [Gemmatimonadaceae bacterium]